MMRFHALLLAMLLLFSATGRLGAQNPGQAVPNPQPGVAPVQPAPGAASSEHNPTFDSIIAFTGVALVMLAVCDPSRRV